MINTLFYFVDDPTFDYQAAINRGDISQYTVVFNTADKCIYTKNTVFSKITRVDVASLLGNISDLLPVATSTTLGAIKIGFDSDDRRYGVKLDSNNRAYVEVPWTDTVAPAYDDTRVVDEIDAQRQRIDGYISQLVDTVQRCNETLLDDAQWVLRNLVAGQVGRQINDNIDEYFRQQYGVWDWVDASDHSKGKIVRTSVIEQNVDSIDIRVGSVEDYRDGYLTTALNNLEMKVGVDLVTGQTKAGTNLINAVSTLDANTNKIVQMAASALQLESVKGGGLLQSTADLASVVVNGRFTGYSGLNEKVTNQGNTISAQGSLMSRVVNNDGTPNSSFKADVIAGLATSAYVDDKVATAKAELSANIDGQGADLTLFVQKDSSGHIESSAKLSADQIYLNGTTWASIIHADQIVTDALSGGNATFKGTITVENGSNNITIDSSGFTGRWSDDGIRLSSNGLDRWDSVSSSWLSLFAKRKVRSLSSGSVTMSPSDDLLICPSTTTRVYLPSGTNGDVLTIRVLNGAGPNLRLSNTSQRIYTDALHPDSDLTNYYLQQNCLYEFVFWSNIWYTNSYGLV